MAADNCIDNEADGASVDRPFIFTIPKGTAVPTSLLLLREDLSEFALLPSKPMFCTKVLVSRHLIVLADLCSILNDFYSEHADKWDAVEWLDDHL
ncbi:hypothetical protein EJ04DRAFT_568148 [Polyplosphaeria fusca]|uniref:Tse2 ADP-ribosyltransferase toxin domain-containing protein n=1 Tax=Polyplosphaeria fusca TaxID=682080 RepID=A0A9P4UYK9_9PLEO|nr:hypothetical protein EJ04DRAFT_568148 [Polyplosphaeria fusca]